MEKCNIWPFVSAFFNLILCFQVSSMLQPILVLIKLLNNIIPLFVYAKLCLSIHQLVIFELFPLWDYVNSADMNIHMQGFL